MPGKRVNLYIKDEVFDRMKKFEDQFPANWSQIASRAFDDYMSDYVRSRLSSINERIKQLKMQKAELGENDD